MIGFDPPSLIRVSERGLFSRSAHRKGLRASSAGWAGRFSDLC